MTARSKFFATATTCLLFSFAMALLGLTGGCGDGAAPQDEATKAKINDLQAKVREAHAKKRLP